MEHQYSSAIVMKLFYSTDQRFPNYVTWNTVPPDVKGVPRKIEKPKRIIDVLIKFELCIFNHGLVKPQIYIYIYIYIYIGYRIPGSLVDRVNKFCTVATNVFSTIIAVFPLHTKICITSHTQSKQHRYDTDFHSSLQNWEPLVWHF